MQETHEMCVFLLPGSVRSPGEGKWQPTPVLLPENPVERGAWWAAVHRVAKSRAWLSDWAQARTFLIGEISMSYPACIVRKRIPKTRWVFWLSFPGFLSFPLLSWIVSLNLLSLRKKKKKLFESYLNILLQFYYNFLEEKLKGICFKLFWKDIV